MEVSGDEETKTPEEEVYGLFPEQKQSGASPDGDADAAVGATETKKTVTIGESVDAVDDDEKVAGLLSKATVHESEAETKLLQAIDEERARNQGKPTTATSAAFPDYLPSKQLPTDREEALRQASSQKLLSKQREVMAKSKGALSNQTHYLISLHHDNGDDFHDDLDAGDVDVQDLVEADSAERIHKAAALLKAAATSHKASAPNNSNNNQASTSPQLQEQPAAAAAEAEPSGEPSNFHNENSQDVEVGGDEPSGSNKFNHLYHKTADAFFAFPSKAREGLKNTLETSRQEWSSFNDFFKPKKRNVCTELCYAMGLILPGIFMAIVLFYWLDNPPTGRCRDGPCGIDSNGHATVASASWWILFFVRQLLTWLLARASDVVAIDWLLLQHLWLVRLLGPRLSLICLQAKGWPSVMFWWAFWDAVLLYGSGDFASNWLYFQDAIRVFTEENPSGDIPTAKWYRGVIIAGLVISVAVSLKRHYVGMHMGQRLHSRFNERLQEVMRDITLVSELALWARRKRDQGGTYGKFLERRKEQRDDSDDSTEGGGDPALLPVTTEGTDLGTPTSESDQGAISRRSVLESFREGEKIDYSQYLEPWKEPKRPDSEEISGNRIIELRQAFAVMTKPYFFSSAFGPVESRKECIRSSERLFHRILKLMGEDESVDLDQMSLWMYKGLRADEEKERAAELIDLLNPDHERRINVLQFIKGIDAVYKKVRLLENAVNNASHVDKGFARLIDICFYLVMFAIILAIMGLDLFALSSFIVAFSFMIGSGCAQVFEGIMLVLGRKAYDVGDKVAIDNVDEPPNPDGSTHWMVEKIDLVTTTARLMGTSEVATFSNGSIARSRIINMNRSPEPIVYVHVRFGTEVPYSTIVVFRSAVQKFIDERPQEWQSMLGFRNTRIASEENFVEYAIVLRHRLTWQSLIPIKESKAAVASFCVELQNQSGCRYKAPSMPVEISMSENAQYGARNPGEETEISFEPAKETESSVQKLLDTAELFGNTSKS